ncbi:hypothetical protein K440DRAFT_636245 [Wilcoxina mikolae CBS 423.85]|nr:hypothetical protein K440DRAFT_636245 [Wilcoxina mikolae CBS 423.85]
MSDIDYIAVTLNAVKPFSSKNNHPKTDNSFVSTKRSTNLRTYLERFLTEITDHIAATVHYLSGSNPSLAVTISTWPRLYITLLLERHRMSEVRGIADPSFVDSTKPLTEFDWDWVSHNSEVVPGHSLLFYALCGLGISKAAFATLWRYKRNFLSADVERDEVLPMSVVEGNVKDYIKIFRVGMEDAIELKELMEVLKMVRRNPGYLYRERVCLQWVLS